MYNPNRRQSSSRMSAFLLRQPFVISLTKRPLRHTAEGMDTAYMTSSVLKEKADGKPTVLIVDDEAAPRAALTQILKQDFNILTAADGRTDLEVINVNGIVLFTIVFTL